MEFDHQERSEAEPSKPPVLQVMNSVTESAKFRNFQKEKPSNHTLEQLPGVGEQTVAKFAEKNITTVCQVIGIYMAQNRQSKVFKDFLINEIGMHARFAQALLGCVEQWAYDHVGP